MKVKIKNTLLLIIAVALFAGAARIVSTIRYMTDADKIIVRFAVTSKTYVSGDECEYLENFINRVYEYADAASDYNTVDAFIINGNVTNDAKARSFETFDNVSQSLLRPESAIYTALAERDYAVGEYDDEVSDPDIEKKIQDIAVNIKGYYFIMLSPVYDSYESKYEWLDSTLKTVTEYNQKPVFVFQYSCLRDTYYGTKDWYLMESESLYDILEQYPTVVDFSSFASTPANFLNSVFQDKASYVNTGAISGMRMNYEEYGNDTSDEIMNDNINNTSQCRIVEVYTDGHVDIKTMNLADGSVYTMPQSTDEMIFTLYPGDEKTYIYKSNNQQFGDAPLFGDDSTDIAILSENTVQISFREAYDMDGMLFYNIKIYSDGSVIKELNTYSDFSDVNHTKKIQINDFLLPDGSQIEITPYDIYGNTGESLKYVYNYVN